MAETTGFYKHVKFSTSS